MSQHATLSPSSAHRWMRCAGSAALEQGLPDDPNEYSDEGAAAHELASWCLSGGKDAQAFLGRVITVDHETQPSRHFTVDEDFAAAVQKYVDSVREYLDAAGEGAELLVEQSLPIGQITGEKDATGTGDAVILAPALREIQVHDLKFGKGVRVDADENEQEMLYALGALFNAELLQDFSDDDRVRLVIHQPRLEHLSEWSCSIAELRQFAKRASERARLATIVLKSGVTDSDLNPGEKQCRFCRAKATCPKLREVALQTAGADFEDLDAAKDAAAKSRSAVPEVADAELVRCLGLVELIEDWCHAIKARGEQLLLSGTKLPGWKLVTGKRGNRAWVDDASVEALFKSFRMKQDEMYEHKLISPTTAEKTFKEEPKRWAKVTALISQADGKPTVVPESDKRPALEITPAADDFQPLDQTEELV